MSESVSLGEICPECGTRRRVIESLPKQPLRARKVRRLEAVPQIEASYPILPVPGSLVGFPTEDEITEDIILARGGAVQLLVFYDEIGWVLEHTFEPAEGESLTEFADTLAGQLTEYMAIDTLETTIDALAEATIPDIGDGGGLLSALSDPDDPDGDYSDIFAPEPGSAREMECLHCGETFEESAVAYEQRFGDYHWWCPTEGCDGAGVGFDIHPVS